MPRRYVKRIAPLALCGCLASGCPLPGDDPIGDDDTTDDDTGDDDSWDGGLFIDEIVGLDHNVLSCLVRWTTDEPASSRVEFGAGALAFFVDGEAQATEHEVFVFGMRAETTYALRACSTFADGDTSCSEIEEFTTGALPFGGFSAEITVFDEAATEPGWLLANLMIEDVEEGEEHQERSLVVMLDAEGQVVWYDRQLDGHLLGGIDTSLVDDGSGVLIGGELPAGARATEIDLRGDVLWDAFEQGELGVSGTSHHVFCKVEGGHYLTLLYDFQAGHLADQVVELDESGEVVWSWSSTQLYDLLPEFGVQATWGNALQFVAGDDAVYYHSRTYSSWVKIRRSDGDVEWVFGRDFAIDPDYQGPYEAFFPTQAHSPVRLDDGNLLVFDNRRPEDACSRVVEYEIDEEARSARMVWEYPGEDVDDPWYQAAW